MVKFIIQILMMLSLAAILFILSRALPRIDDRALNQKTPSQHHWFISYLEKADEWLKAFFEKFLRRVRVWILKLDNAVAQKLSRFKKETPRNSVLSITDIAPENKKEDQETTA